ncbi:Gfo/Idh/MocA family protein [Gracilinema caldarium]|uniref:Oxidoreductase domain protein n=1 Tax=Gracilinema caldarium (strain ATCC 51460 / DSM 7334 / H1) TaxID=744872 RepID=F8F3A7_GRAC1|nr:Gfo/Idh/MocA family oxidoreductase [Gracilinema caldarium]AEJ20944.1 oxidoreductase domain protein [Gracilinema caldarium DSM 7334]
MNKVRFGILTYGKVAHLHAQAIRSNPELELVAVWGRDRQKREQFAATYGIQAFNSISEMIQRAHLDAVLVASPHPQHVQHSLEALEAGAHVLIEKPMALTKTDCDRVIETAERFGLKVGVISQRRWYPAVQRIREAINAGKIGTPMIGQVTMLGWRDEAYYKSDPWRGSWSREGGGVLVNQAPHQLDLLQWFMGPATEVFAYWDNINHPYIEVEDTALALIRFTSGGMATILVSNSQKPGIYAKVHIHGSSGASVGVQTDGGAMFVAGLSKITEAPFNDIWTIPGEEDNLKLWKAQDADFFGIIDTTLYFHGLQIKDFADAIVQNRPPLVDGKEGRKTVALIEAIYQSGKERRPISL